MDKLSCSILHVLYLQTMYIDRRSVILHFKRVTCSTYINKMPITRVEVSFSNLILRVNFEYGICVVPGGILISKAKNFKGKYKPKLEFPRG